MPELPEVETVRLALCRNVQGKSLTKIIYIRPDYIRYGFHHQKKCMPGKLIEVERRGKFLCLHLDNGFSLMHHLGMSGRLLLLPSSTKPEKHTHFRIQIGDGKYELQQSDPRRFGFVALFAPGELDSYPSWSNLGPDPFFLTSNLLLNILQSSKRPIKSLLLDQKKIAGLGNIYVDESLHRSGLHPLRSSDSVSIQESKKLCRVIKTVLKEAVAAGGTSTNDYRHLDGTFGSFQNRLRVYQQEGKECKTCGKIIEKIILTGRGTHYCPVCQPLT